MSEAMQFENHSIESFQDNLNIILDRLKIPKGLNELGVPEDCIRQAR